uniref:Uncharacterized protein n=1 Tax=Arion vulgaris TaxID=1028688 RepID=A0A0B6ZUF4_9EUPU
MQKEYQQKKRMALIMRLVNEKSSVVKLLLSAKILSGVMYVDKIYDKRNPIPA